MQALESNLKANKEKMLVIAEALELNSNKINDLGLSSNDLTNLKMDVTSINTQIMLLDDSINALNSYKNQLNQVILEIQTKVSNLSMDDLEIDEIN
jgi:chromosome segregation ATPase